MSEPSARVIADSVSEEGIRLTTMVVKCHRFVLAEFNTHRAFSRNSASSRAIPLSKQIARVMDDPAIPVSFPAEQRGMQGGEELDGADREEAVQVWLNARDAAVEEAEDLRALGVHKSVVNRLLEPFMWHEIVVTATDWDGFWRQRCSPLAQPEIRVAAEAMRTAYNETTFSDLLTPGTWHLPFVQPGEFADVRDAKRVSTARCARVSLLTHEGRRDPSADLELYERLVSAEPPHASPLEHVATPRVSPAVSPPGNFRGWHQLRHLVLGF